MDREQMLIDFVGGILDTDEEMSVEEANEILLFAGFDPDEVSQKFREIVDKLLDEQSSRVDSKAKLE